MTVYSIGFFDTWQPTYGGAVVTILKAGTSAKADIFKDFAQTQPAANPQTLNSLERSNICYGMWDMPLYTSQAIEINIGGSHQTAVLSAPLTTLIDVDASLATVRATGTLIDRTLAEVAADNIVTLQDGVLGVSASGNSAIIQNSIGRAAAAGGGRVDLPAGTYPITTLSLPKDVLLNGAGENTTILTSLNAGNVITLADDGAGMVDLTLDGVNLVIGSTGVFGIGLERTILERVTIKRFDTNMHFKGHKYARWRDLTLSGATTNLKAHGDTDAGDTADGGEFSFNEWHGGACELAVTTGIDMLYEDDKVIGNIFSNIRADSNIGIFVKVRGAQQTEFHELDAFGNGVVFDIDDDDLTTVSTDNEVIGFRVHRSRLNGGSIKFQGRCQDIFFSGTIIEDVDIVLTLPQNMIVFEDTIEDALVTVAGTTEKLGRHRKSEKVIILGQTTDATAIRAFSITLEPGEMVYAEAVVMARSKTNLDRAFYHESAGARRPGSDLDYDAQTVDYTVGEILTGATSGATAIIQADADSGGTGTLTLVEIVPGPNNDFFLDGEIITDAAGGSADVNGVLQPQNAVLDMVQASLRAAFESPAGFAITFLVTAGDIQIDVTGIAAQTVDWTVEVRLVRT